MAEKKNSTMEELQSGFDKIAKASEEKQKELVPLFLKRLPDPNASQEEFYSFNFKNYLIKRGVTVYVPKEVKAIVDEHERAESEALAYIAEIGIREA